MSADSFLFFTSFCNAVLIDSSVNPSEDDLSNKITDLIALKASNFLAFFANIAVFISELIFSSISIFFQFH